MAPRDDCSACTKFGELLKTIAVTGAAGFIGSHLCDRLLAEGYTVRAVDDLSTGIMANLSSASRHRAFTFFCGDIQDAAVLDEALKGVDTLFHMAGNADVRYGLADPLRDLRANTNGTVHVLAACVRQSVARFVLASTCAVYGDADTFPTSEDVAGPQQTSLYGASKISAEAFAAAFSEGYGLHVVICRLVSVLGTRYRHGHVKDFVEKLCSDPTQVEVLGNGFQQKSYIWTDDCVEGLLRTAHAAADRPQFFNIGHPETLTVRQSLSFITQELGVQPRVKYGDDGSGWIGDASKVLPDCSAISQLGWTPKTPLEQAVRRTARDVRLRITS